MINNKILVTIVIVFVFMGGCDVLDHSPKQAIPSEQVYTSESNVRAALAGAYNELQDVVPDHVTFAELAAGTAVHSGSLPSWGAIDQHSIVPGANEDVLSMWTEDYSVIGITNNIIAYTPGVEDEGFTEEEKAHIIAEAKIIRAWSYHSLVRWFGGVPLVLKPTKGISEEVFVSRSSVSAVYDQIIEDLTEAAAILGINGSPGAITATGYAALALLSRVYLYTEQYKLAEQAATKVINSGVYSLPEDYIANWGATASASPVPDETIWTLEFTAQDGNGLAFVAFPVSAGGRREYAPTNNAADTYEKNDERINANLRNVGGVTVLGKYFRVVEGDDNVIIIRLGEVYLNRAEARARQGDIKGAIADINVIRERAGLDPVSANSKSAVLNIILEERRHELFLEGHRWFDLRRFGVAQEVLNITDPNMLLWPIPERAINVNPKLEQNPGY